MTNILSKIATKKDLSLFKSEIEVLISSLYKYQEDGLENALNNDVRSWVAEEIRKNLKNKKEAEEYFKSIIKDTESIDFINITLAYEPSQSALGRISSWVKTNVGEKTLLDIEYDPNLLGGAKIAYKGKYLDATLKKQIDIYFDTQRDVVVGKLKSYGVL